MDSNHKHAIHWARQTAASHRYKLKRQPACQPSTSFAFTSSDRTLREKGLLFFSFFKAFLSIFASKMCFYLHLTAHRCATWLNPECECLSDIATKRKQHIIIAIWNVTTVPHAWGTDFWHIVTLGRCFQLKTSSSSWTGNKIYCPALWQYL